ncbi:MAG: methylmalonyl Co-A mutase-associated GTPase MeaB [Bacteroidota bacterium]
MENNPLQTDKKNKTALEEMKGVEKLPDINLQAVKKMFVNLKKELSTEAYVKGIREGNRTILSKAITLVESSRPEHYRQAQEIIEQCIPHAVPSVRIGITGVPGVGKSTFIEAFGMQLISQGHKIAVLAVDPSSEISKGSILGDKTRMENLSVNSNAFIRPSPSAGSLGGVARKTREIIFLCETAGFDRILVETVGVGQSETTVHSMVDFFLLLMLAGAGDAIVINKADTDNITNAQKAKVQYQNALHLFPPAPSGWTPRVETCSSIYKTNLDNIGSMIDEYMALVKKNGFFNQKRKNQHINHMYENIRLALTERFYQHPEVIARTDETIKALENNQLTSYQAAEKLLKVYFGAQNQND